MNFCNGSTLAPSQQKFWARAYHALQAGLLIDGKSTTYIERVYIVQYHIISHLDSVDQWIKQWTCKLKVVSSIPRRAIFFFFIYFFHSERIDAAQEGTWMYPQIFDLYVSSLYMGITCLCVAFSESTLTILKAIFRKFTLSEKFWRPEIFFSPC